MTTENLPPGTVLRLTDSITAQPHDVVVRRLIVAGFTGRDESDVEAHLEELRALGVPVPDSTPAFYELEPALLTTGNLITVEGAMTSGEVEPVVVNRHGDWLLCVGSDHTDREVERLNIEASKSACAKVVSSKCVRVDQIGDWDSIRIRSWLDSERSPYQDGSLAELLPLDEIVALARESVGELTHGAVLFLGTVPVLGGQLRHSSRFDGELSIPGIADPLKVSYRVA